MSFLEKAQQKQFWINFLKVTIPFFILVIIVALIMGSSRDIFAGNWEAVDETNFANGKWKSFFGYKIFLSALYGLWITNKNMK